MPGLGLGIHIFVPTVHGRFKTWMTGTSPVIGRFFDRQFVDGSFDKGCEEIYSGGGLLARMQTGRVQHYLRLLAVAFVVLAAILIWSSRP